MKKNTEGKTAAFGENLASVPPKSQTSYPGIVSGLSHREGGAI
jgi:hypothetical protein